MWTAAIVEVHILIDVTELNGGVRNSSAESCFSFLRPAFLFPQNLYNGKMLPDLSGTERQTSHRRVRWLKKTLSPKYIDLVKLP